MSSSLKFKSDGNRVNLFGEVAQLSARIMTLTIFLQLKMKHVSEQ